MIRVFLLGTAFCVVIPVLGYSQTKWGCEASPAIQHEIDRFQDEYDSISAVPEAERLATLERLMAEHPQEPSLRLALGHELRGHWVPGRAPLVEKLRQAANEESAGPWEKAAYASALIGSQTRESVEILESLVKAEPDFAPSHSLLAYIYVKPNFRDKAKLEMHQAELLRLCADSVDSYSNLESAEKSAFVDAAARRFRTLIESRSERKTIAAYDLLWTLEFKAVGADVAALRQRVSGDIARIRKFPAADLPELESLLAEGYKLTGDTEEAKKHDLLKYDGMPGMRGYSAVRQFTTDHPKPKPEASRAEREAYAKLEFESLTPLESKFPGAYYLVSALMSAASGWPSVPAADLKRVAEESIQVAQRERSPQAVGAASLTVAAAFVDHGVFPERVPELVQPAIENAAAGLSYSTDLYPPDPSMDQRDNLQAARAWALMAKARIQLGEMDQARTAMANAERMLQSAVPRKSDDGFTRQYYGAMLAGYREDLALAAIAEGHKPDALAWYRSAIEAYGQPTSPWYMDRLEDLRAHARSAWDAAGGTDSGWKIWSAAPAATAPESMWSELSQAVPDFDLKDMEGKTWKLTQLHGKTVLINYWATWCGPCREELPYVQKLWNQIQERKDIGVITFNVDDNPGLIQPFLTENKYTFPVLLAKDYVDAKLPFVGIPRNLVMDPNGRLRLELLGFGADPTWVSMVQETLERKW